MNIFTIFVLSMWRKWLDANQVKENLFGVAIRCGQDQTDEYGNLDG